MNLPIYTKFYKKIDAFLDIRNLDNQFRLQLKEFDEEENKIPPTWEMEKKVLFWSFFGHKKLGSEVTQGHMGFGTDGKSDLNKDNFIDWEEAKKIGAENTLNNLVELGFGKGSATQGVKLNQKAYLYAEVLNETFRIRKASEEYKEKLKGVRQLNPNFFFYFKYYLSIFFIWYLFILGVFLLGLNIFNLIGLLDDFKNIFLETPLWLPNFVIIYLPLLILVWLSISEALYIKNIDQKAKQGKTKVQKIE